MSTAAPKRKLTFQKPQEIVRPSIEDCPVSDEVILRIPSVDGLSHGARFRANVNHGTVGKEIIIEFDQMAGAMVELSWLEVEDRYYPL